MTSIRSFLVQIEEFRLPTLADDITQRGTISNNEMASPDFGSMLNSPAKTSTISDPFPPDEPEDLPNSGDIS